MGANEESSYILKFKRFILWWILQKKCHGDGNCYFRVISYYYWKNENYYKEFRQLIHYLFVENNEKFKDFSPDAYIVGDKEPENEEQILNILNEFREKMGQDKTWVGDIEIVTTTHYLGVNINILIRSELLLIQKI